MNPKNPFGSDDYPPSYMDYQVASILIQRVLMPLREKVLQEYQSMVLDHRPENWFATFLVSFILLHNCELQVQFQLLFAEKRKSVVSAFISL